MKAGGQVYSERCRPSIPLEGEAEPVLAAVAVAERLHGGGPGMARGVDLGPAAFDERTHGDDPRQQVAQEGGIVQTKPRFSAEAAPAR